MPVTPTYPGVYIEEIPSGVRTITGVATSITAFIGRALKGAVNESLLINNFGDFERLCGGLAVGYPLSYAMRDFYLNGGSQAIIVRLYRDPINPGGLAVARALESLPANPTADQIKNHAKVEADKHTDEPAKSAAQAVLAEISAAADAGTAIEEIKAQALKKAAELTLTSTARLEFGGAAKTAASAVLDAVKTAAGEKDAKPADLDAAAKDEAAKFTADPAKKAASDVSAAVTAAAAPADATVAAVLTAAETAAKAAYQGEAQPLKLVAASPGAWGNGLVARVDVDGISDQVAQRFGMQAADLFNLNVQENPPDGPRERILNLSFKDGPRRIDRVLQAESLRVRVPLKADGEPDLPAADASAAPSPSTIAFGFEGGHPSAGLETTDYTGSKADKTGLYALEKADLFNLLCIPPDVRSLDTDPGVYQAAMAYCVDRRAMLIVDSPAGWGKPKETAASKAKDRLGQDLPLSGPATRNVALYFPRVIEADPLRENQLDTFVPCGIVAGVMARTDVERGVWKAPAGADAALNGIRGLQVNLTDDENGLLNPLGVNCLRSFPVTGRVVWGARTMRGADQLADEYKYVPIRRLALYIEESLYRGTQWVVFEPNDEPLWAQIRLNVGAFMHTLFRKGAFEGRSPREAYFVKCDGETTPATDRNLGIVNIVVGFAPLKPAEFVIIKLQQIAGQVQA